MSIKIFFRALIFFPLIFSSFNILATSLFFNKTISADLINIDKKQAINNQIEVLELGISALKTGQFTLAEQIASKAVATNTNNFNAHLLLVFSYLGQGKNQALLQYLQQIKTYKTSFYSALVLNLAQYFYQNKQYYRALKQLKYVEDEEHLLVQKFKLYAQIYQAQNRVDLAIESYQKVLTLIPVEYESILELARLSLVKNEYQAARVYAKSTIEQQPTNRDGYFILGIANLLDNKVPSAYDAFNTIKTLSLEDNVTESYRAICLYLLNKKSEALLLVDTFKNKNAQPPIEFSFVKALFALKNNQQVLLQQSLVEIKTSNTKDPLLYVFSAAKKALVSQEKASIYSDLALASALIIDFSDEQKLAQHYPISASQLTMLAEVALFYRQGLHKNVITQTAKEPQQHFSLKLYYARASWQLNQAQQAIEEYQKIIKQSPDLIAPRLELADIYYFQQKGQQALELYQQVVDEQPKNYNLMLRLANLYNSLGDATKAIGYYKKVLEINRDAYVYNQLAGTYSEKLHDYQMALKYAKLGDAKDNSHSIVKDTLADIYFNLGQYQAAMDIYVSLIELTKNTFPATTYYNIAKNYDALNQAEQASIFYELSLNTGYDFDYTKQAEQRLKTLWK